MFSKLSVTDLAIIAVALDEESSDDSEESEEYDDDESVDEIQKIKELQKVEEIQRIENTANKRMIATRKRRDKMRENKRPRRSWATNTLEERKRAGEFYLVYKKMLDDETKFYQHFSVSLHQFHDVLSKIESVIKKKDTVFREAITPNEKLAVCFRFLTTGSSIREIASDYKLGIATVWNIVHDVCNAIIDKMLHEQMPMLQQNDWENIADDFWRLWHFPNCAGVLAGKCVQIDGTQKSGYKFLKNKNSTIELFSLINAQCKFIMVDVGSYRDNGENDFFATSDLGLKLKYELTSTRLSRPFPNSDDPMPFIVIGDNGFASKNYLLNPYSSTKDDENKNYFNHRLLRTRKVVDDVFDALTQKFRIYNRVIKCQPQVASKIVLTTCILHNYIGDFSKTTDQNYENKNSFSCLKNIPSRKNRNQVEAPEIREAFKQFFFVNRNLLPET